jgi:hypothetical protein
MALAKGWKARKRFFFAIFYFSLRWIWFTAKKNKDYPSRDTNIDCSWLVSRLLCQSLTAFFNAFQGEISQVESGSKERCWSVGAAKRWWSIGWLAMKMNSFPLLRIGD